MRRKLIAYRWHYREKSEHAIYNISSNEETLKEILDPDRREKMYYVVGKDEVFGFFRSNKSIHLPLL